jgi:hypothetical protein
MSALQAPPAGVRTWETDHGVKLRMPTAAYPYYRIDYRLGGIRRTPCAGRDWQAAWAEANRIDALVAAECGAQSQLAVRDLAAQWFAAESRRWRSQRHREDTRGYLDRVILPGIGKVPLDTLRRSDIRALLEGISRDSVERKVRNVVGAMLAWGHAEQWLGITREALMPPPRRSEDADDEGTYVDPAEIPDESDVVALYRALREPRTFASKHARAYTPPEWLSMMPVLAACTGARQGECFALQGKDVSGDRLLIDQQVQLVAGRPALVLRLGRGACARCSCPSRFRPTRAILAAKSSQAYRSTGGRTPRGELRSVRFDGDLDAHHLRGRITTRIYLTCPDAGSMSAIRYVPGRAAVNAGRTAFPRASVTTCARSTYVPPAWRMRATNVVPAGKPPAETATG